MHRDARYHPVLTIYTQISDRRKTPGHFPSWHTNKMSRKTAEHFEVDRSDSEDEGTSARRGHAAKRTKPPREKQIAQKAMGKNVKSANDKPAKTKSRRSAISKKGKIEGVRKSADNVIKAFAAIKRAQEKTWAISTKAPMNMRACRNDSSKSRTQYIIRRAAFSTAASGAAAYVSAVANEELKRYNLRNGDSSKFPLEERAAPCLPSVTDGARMLLTQYLTAYAQTALHNAKTVRMGSRKKTVSAQFMTKGFERAAEQFGDDVNHTTIFFSQRMSDENHEKKKRIQAAISRKEAEVA